MKRESKPERRRVPKEAVSKRAPKSVSKASTVQFWSSVPTMSWQSSLFGGLHEPWTGAWQGFTAPTGATLPLTTSSLAFSAVYCCVTGISSDIGKLPPVLMREDEDHNDIWEKVDVSPFLSVLRKPNPYQTRIQFLEQWMLSKLLSGNTYVGLERDNRGIIQRMYVLDPCRVRPLIADNGEVFYELMVDPLNRITENIVVMASEIIHDRMECLWHPLVGVSPLYACMATVGLGNSIQANSQVFFANASQPGGMLSAPGRISDDTAARMKAAFESRFSGGNIGRLFVAGDGLEFKPFALTADQSQLVEQLKWSVEDVARAFHYPAYKLDTSKLPPYSGNNIQTLQMQYLTDCLQKHIEAIEELLEIAFDLPTGLHIMLDTEVLLRMDTQTLYRTITEGIKGQWLSSNEGRAKVNLKPVKGGEFPRAQMQYIPLPVLAENPLPQKIAPAPAPASAPEEATREALVDLLIIAITRELETASA